MVKPVYLQDNLSKIWIAQRMIDQRDEGAEQLKYIKQGVDLREIEKEQRNQAAAMEEKANAKGVNPDGKGQGKQGALRKEREETEERQGQSEEELEQDLRRRREEDDIGKGGTLDVRG